MIDHDEPDEHDEEGYFGDVEAHFIERRGGPLFITPAEWFLVSKWEEQGIPLDVVKEGIDRVFERPQAAAKSRKLGYCRQTVEAAFRRFREVTLGGGDHRGPVEDRFDAAAHLSRLASKLSGLSRLAGAPDLAARVEALGDSGETLQRIEDALTAIDDELIENAEDTLDENDRVALLSAAGASLASYRDRMPDKVYQSALRSAYRRRLRDKTKLPRLSLYDR
ncbi:MAG: hypothetical protein BMS9Abin37_0643 [Acidobacteriota bacterium]|nr:MAG: hypothetical protein BMS9Abin37_0643 [Acidobacteriota bacterium]